MSSSSKLASAAAEAAAAQAAAAARLSKPDVVQQKGSFRPKGVHVQVTPTSRGSTMSWCAQLQVKSRARRVSKNLRSVLLN
jgi:hypothetical protein